MIEEYKSEVLRFYEQKKDAGELSTKLTHPTPANICKEFYQLLSAGCDPADLRMLKDFFEMAFESQLSAVPYRKWDADKFRPLCNFLKKGIETREKNIEFLAWLIDYQPRPFSNFCRLSKGSNELFSDLAVTENGVVDKHNFDELTPKRNDLQMQEKTHENSMVGSFRFDHLIDSHEVSKNAGYSQDYTRISKEIILEYPSGVRLTVDASDLSLIAQLIRL